MKKCLLCVISALLAFYAAGCSPQPEVPELKRPAMLEGVKFDEHMDISLSFWGIQDLEDGGKRDSVTKYLEQLFNVTFEPVSVTWTEYQEKYNILARTGSLPDIIASNMSGNYNLQNMLDKAAVRALPKNLGTFPKVKNIVENVGSDAFRHDGKQYAIPRTSFESEELGSTDAALLVRSDWMETLGISDPQSFKEFSDMLVRFVKDDPDGNGQNDTLGLNVNNRYAMGKWLILGIAPECNVYTWTQKNGRFIPSYATPDFDKVVSAYRTLYQNGGLDPEFYIKKPTDSVNDFLHGKLGALEYKSSPSSLWEIKCQWDRYQNTPFEESVRLLHIFPADNGKYYSNTSALYWSESLFSSKVSDEKMERILWLYEYLLSEDGWRLTRFGLEGEDYTTSGADISVNFEYDKDYGTQGILLEKYPSLKLFASLASWGGTREDFQDISALRYGDAVIKMAEEDLLWNIENTVPVRRPYAFYDLIKDENAQFGGTRIIDDFTRVILGSGDPVEEWHAILDGYNAEGLQEYIEEKNEQAKSVGLKP